MDLCVLTRLAPSLTARTVTSTGGARTGWRSSTSVPTECNSWRPNGLRRAIVSGVATNAILKEMTWAKMSVLLAFSGNLKKSCSILDKYDINYDSYLINKFF